MYPIMYVLYDSTPSSLGFVRTINDRAITTTQNISNAAHFELQAAAIELRRLRPTYSGLSIMPTTSVIPALPIVNPIMS